jgi:hypothetical protein
VNGSEPLRPHFGKAGQDETCEQPRAVEFAPTPQPNITSQLEKQAGGQQAVHPPRPQGERRETDGRGRVQRQLAVCDAKKWVFDAAGEYPPRNILLANVVLEEKRVLRPGSNI